MKLFIEVEHHIVAHNSRGCLTDTTVNYGHIHNYIFTPRVSLYKLPYGGIVNSNIFVKRNFILLLRLFRQWRKISAFENTSKRQLTDESHSIVLMSSDEFHSMVLMREEIGVSR